MEPLTAAVVQSVLGAVCLSALPASLLVCSKQYTGQRLPILLSTQAACFGVVASCLQRLDQTGWDGMGFQPITVGPNAWAVCGRCLEHWKGMRAWSCTYSLVAVLSEHRVALPLNSWWPCVRLYVRGRCPSGSSRCVHGERLWVLQHAVWLPLQGCLSHAHSKPAAMCVGVCMPVLQSMEPPFHAGHMDVMQSCAGEDDKHS